MFGVETTFVTIVECKVTKEEMHGLMRKGVTYWAVGRPTYTGAVRKYICIIKT